MSNETTVTPATEATVTSITSKKGRGRPKGSKNKAKVTEVAQAV